MLITSAYSDHDGLSSHLACGWLGRLIRVTQHYFYFHSAILHPVTPYIDGELLAHHGPVIVTEDRVVRRSELYCVNAMSGRTGRFHLSETWQDQSELLNRFCTSIRMAHEIVSSFHTTAMDGG